MIAARATAAVAPASHRDLVRAVLDAAFAGGAHLAYTDGAFQRFQHTHWITLSADELGGIILRHLPPETGQVGRHLGAVIREIIDLLKMHRATGPDRARLAEPLPIINVANGELWIGLDGTVELRPHDPASGQRYCLDVVYDPGATCAVYDHTLAEIYANSGSPATLVAMWHELSGYVLQPARPDARIFVGWGPGNDGKSALVGLLIRLLGRDRVAALPIGKLASNPFMLSHLVDKALFLDDDVAVGTVLPDGVLKTISEAKVVTGEPKHRDPFEFEVRAVPLLLCNVPPRLRDISHGCRRRLTIIPFNRSFSDAEADRTLFLRIWATERSGVLNRALEGLRRVIRRGWKFDPPATVVAATEAWWAEATDGPVESAKPVRGSPTMQSKPGAVPPAGETGAAQRRTRAARPHPAGSPLDLSISIALRDACESFKVNVQVGTATVEVRIAGATRLDPPRPVRADG